MRHDEHGGRPLPHLSFRPPRSSRCILGTLRSRNRPSRNSEEQSRMSTNSADKRGVSGTSSQPVDGTSSDGVDLLAEPRNGAAPIDPVSRRRSAVPQIEWREERRGTLPGNKYVRVLRAQDQVFRQVTPDYL